MEQHDLEIEIDATGKVHARIRGAKGKACLEYAKLLESIVGRQDSQELTSEYYEPDSSVHLAPYVENRQSGG